MTPEISALVLEIVPQAGAIARRYYQKAPHALRRDDLESIAYEGLVQAANAWPDYCLVPETLVLTADLRWVPVGSLVPGQELVGVDEWPVGGGGGRYYRRAAVQEAVRRVAGCLCLTLEDGRQVTCTPSHKWLLARQRGYHTVAQRAARAAGVRGSSCTWWRADEISPGDKIVSPLRVWAEGTSFADGWLSGLIDGEGSIQGKSSVSIPQNPGDVMDQVKQYLAALDIPFRYRERSDSVGIAEVGVRRYALELLGSLRPVRLLPKASWLWEDRQIYNRGAETHIRVMDVEAAGLREVVTIETSTGTFLANGLVSHNCARNGYQPDGEGLKFFGAYATRRMNGAILDHMRSLDWVPRSVRQAWKSLQENGADAGATEAELSAGTGLSVPQIRATRSALARRPVSLDDGDRDLPEDHDVDSQVRVAQILAAVKQAGNMLSRQQRVVVALRYYQGMSVAEIAMALGMPRRDVVAAHDQAVRSVRQAMAAAVA